MSITFIPDEGFPRKKPLPSLQDRIRGCLFGGGAGDALGYYVEFMLSLRIFELFGPDGITSYKKDRASGKALISDDTQMVLFTANGILSNAFLTHYNHTSEKVEHTIAQSYQDWLYTQCTHYSPEVKKTPRASWLLDVPELFQRRAPGNTCLQSLITRADSPIPEDFLASAINNSKGCGSVMRVAPLSLIPWSSIEDLHMAAAQVSAITHCHPLGYISSSVLCHVIYRILFPTEEKMTLLQTVEEARATANTLFAGKCELHKLNELIDEAISRSQNEESDLDNINHIGQGWVAEEALAVALYCALKYPNDFSKAIIAAANHGGDSDSTAAIAGNIVGAIVGYDAMEEEWKEDLECTDVILELADDLYQGYCEGSFCPDKIPNGYSKYIMADRFPKDL